MLSMKNVLWVFTIIIAGLIAVSAQINKKSLINVSKRLTLLTAKTKTEPYWFFANPALAKRKIIPVSELIACMLGDTIKPSVKGKFKEEITATALNQARLLDAGKCDVAVAFDDRPDGLERIKKDRAGFAIYKISGTNLELIYEPQGGYIAVGKMELASQNTLEKKDLSACGEGSLRDVFRPNPRIWKSWMQKYVRFENLKSARELEQENALLYGCDIWIFTSGDYEKFSKKYGKKYPLFEVTPENPVLTRRK